MPCRLLGASLSYEEWVTRSAAGLIASTENRLKGVKDAQERNMGALMKRSSIMHRGGQAGP